MSTLQSTLKLSVIDGVSSKMRAITGSMNALRGQSRQIMSPINGTIARVAGLAAGYIGVREGIRGTVGAAMGFESAFADVRKVVDGSDNQLNTLRRDIIALSKEMPVSAEGFAQIYAAAGQSNIPIQEMKKFSKTVAEVSTAWEVPVAETGQSLAEIKNQLRMNVDEISLFADAINHIGNNTAARTPDLVDYSKRVAATGQMYGFAAAETLAFGGAMIASGAQSEVAATSFRNMGRALTIGSRATKSHREAYSKLGLDSVKVAKSMQKNAVKTTLDVIDKIQQLPEWERISIATALFGDEARALMPVINNASDLRRQLDLVGDSANYAGSSFEEYRKRAETTANTLDKVKNNFAALGIGIGDSMLPTINNALTGVLDVFSTLEKRSGFFDEFKTGMSGFMNGLGFKDARELVNGLADLTLGPVLDPKGMSETGEGLGRLFMKMKEWGTSLRDFSAAIKESPIASFLAEMTGQGLKMVLFAAGVGVLAGAIMKLGKALFILSGASLGLKILRGVISAGGMLVGAGGAAAAAGTAAAGAGAGAGAVATGTSLASLMTRLKGLAITSAPALITEGLAATPGDTFEEQVEQQKKYKEDLKRLLGPLATKEFWLGEAAKPDFNFKQHFGIGGISGGAQQPVSDMSEFSNLLKTLSPVARDNSVALTAPTIADLNKPSGTQDVRVTNQTLPPIVNTYITVNAATQANPAEIGAAAGDAAGQANKAAIESIFSDAATN